MPLRKLAVFFGILAVVAWAAWLVFDIPALEPVGGFLGAVAAVMGAVGTLQVNRKLAIALGVVGLVLLVWGVVRALPVGGHTVRQSELNELHKKGGEASEKGQYREALNYYQQALGIFLEVEDRAGEGAVLCDIGTAYYNQGLYDQALEYHRQALAILREVGYRAAEGTTLDNIGLVYRAKGSYDQALEYYRQALVIAREIGARSLEESVLSHIEALPAE